MALPILGMFYQADKLLGELVSLVEHMPECCFLTGTLTRLCKHTLHSMVPWQTNINTAQGKLYVTSAAIAGTAFCKHVLSLGQAGAEGGREGKGPIMQVFSLGEGGRRDSMCVATNAAFELQQLNVVAMAA